ncbi:MAG TPA: hypothetical protein VFR31_17380 [Thermoanaerobaculia bacterium]|nr:hypothetical protein [Thermoanaerobaculia bacterium]
MFRIVRALALAVILVLISASAVQARPLSSSNSGGNVIERLLNWIEGLISPAMPDVTSVWEKSGSSMDPNG